MIGQSNVRCLAPDLKILLYYNYANTILQILFSAVQHERGPRKRRASASETPEVKCKKERKQRGSGWENSINRRPFAPMTSSGITSAPSMPLINKIQNEPSVLAAGLQKQAFHAGFVHRFVVEVPQCPAVPYSWLTVNLFISNYIF